MRALQARPRRQGWDLTACLLPPLRDGRQRRQVSAAAPEHTAPLYHPLLPSCFPTAFSRCPYPAFAAWLQLLACAALPVGGLRDAGVSPVGCAELASESRACWLPRDPEPGLQRAQAGAIRTHTLAIWLGPSSADVRALRLLLSSAGPALKDATEQRYAAYRTRRLLAAGPQGAALPHHRAGGAAAGPAACAADGGSRAASPCAADRGTAAGRWPTSQQMHGTPQTSAGAGAGVHRAVLTAALALLLLLCLTGAALVLSGLRSASLAGEVAAARAELAEAGADVAADLLVLRRLLRRG